MLFFISAHYFVSGRRHVFHSPNRATPHHPGEVSVWKRQLNQTTTRRRERQLTLLNERCVRSKHTHLSFFIFQLFLCCVDASMQQTNNNKETQATFSLPPFQRKSSVYQKRAHTACIVVDFVPPLLYTVLPKAIRRSHCYHSIRDLCNRP